MNINSNGMKGMKVDPFSLAMSANFKLFKERLEVTTSVTNILRFRNNFEHELYTADFTQYTNLQTHAVPLEIRLAWRLGSFKVKPIRKAHKGAVINDAWVEE